MGKRDYWKEHYNNIMRQVPKLKDVVFKNKSYLDLEIPNNSIIYCDPLYQYTTKYAHPFDHNLFWEWVREKSKEGYKVFVSEYNAPDDFTCVWSKHTVSTVRQGKANKAIERLFIYDRG